jgi:hypothetical protein
LFRSHSKLTVIVASPAPSTKNAASFPDFMLASMPNSAAIFVGAAALDASVNLVASERIAAKQLISVEMISPPHLRQIGVDHNRR